MNNRAPEHLQLQRASLARVGSVSVGSSSRSNGQDSVHVESDDMAARAAKEVPWRHVTRLIAELVKLFISMAEASGGPQPKWAEHPITKVVKTNASSMSQRQCIQAFDVVLEAFGGDENGSTAFMHARMLTKGMPDVAAAPTYLREFFLRVPGLDVRAAATSVIAFAGLVTRTGLSQYRAHESAANSLFGHALLRSFVSGFCDRALAREGHGVDADAELTFAHGMVSAWAPAISQGFLPAMELDPMEDVIAAFELHLVAERGHAAFVDAALLESADLDTHF